MRANRSAEPIEFAKMAGGGNDFIMVDNRDNRVKDPVQFCKRICTRRLSAGADGLILIENSARATFRMHYYNRDGSLGEFCANGTRCAARFALLNVISPRRMTIETDSGVVSAEVTEKLVTLTLPPPQHFRAERPLQLGDLAVVGSSIRVGVPHYVAFLSGPIWKHDIVPAGRRIRLHPDLQPEGANVNFVVVRDRHSIDVRTFERGVEDETLSCGSGVVASVAVSALFGRTDSPVAVLTRSGITLEVSFSLRPDGGTDRTVEDVRLTGDARLIYRASVTSETIEGFDPDWAENPTEMPREP